MYAATNPLEACGTVWVRLHNIPRCHGNRRKYITYKLKEGSSKLDWNIQELRSHLALQGLLNPFYHAQIWKV